MKLAVIAMALSMMLSFGFLGGCTKHEEAPAQQPADQAAPAVPSEAPAAAVTAAGASGASAQPVSTKATAEADLTPDAAGLSKAVVVMKSSRGTIRFKLYSKDAPKTAKRFVELVQSKFYNGLTFHRIEPGFVVQTGDPKSKLKDPTQVGSGGSGQKLKAEFNGRKHVRGTVAMARAVDPDSADSQFYITLGTFPHLDNNYTIFGQVVDYGEKQADKDVLDRIRQWDEIIDIHIE